jgi:patatin-like phospholipase/acyl hydrolase
MITILSIWIGTRIRIQKIETTVNLKFIEMEKQILESNNHNNEWITGIKQMIDKFLLDNKEEHRELIHDMKNVRTCMGAINEKLAYLKGVVKIDQCSSEVEEK